MAQRVLRAGLMVRGRRFFCLLLAIGGGLAMFPALGGCHLCEAPDVTTTSSLDLPEGAACPSPEDAKAQLGVIEVLGPAVPTHVAGSENCCYDVDVQEPALDEVVEVEYAAASPCENIEACHCVAGSALIGSAEANLLRFVPEDAVVVGVESGPTYDYFANCSYQVRVRRPGAVVQKHRCTISISIPSGAASPQYCPPSSMLLEPDVLTNANDETIVKVVSGPALESIRLPADRCDYPVRAKGGTADVCG
jgi:hypothetical protein